MSWVWVAKEICDSIGAGCGAISLIILIGRENDSRLVRPLAALAAAAVAWIAFWGMLVWHSGST
jgi:small neutral amino acid transporter SnatA (MarC family)